MTERIAVYPGTFDPITIGHMDIIRRARKLCDKLIIASAVHHSKKPFFTPEKRVDLINAALEEDAHNTDLCPVEAVSFDGLLVDFAKDNNAKLLIRGLRTVSDFDYEFQMVGVNRQLDPNIDTIFLPADMTTQFISSSLAKQLVQYGGDLTNFLPQKVISLIAEES